MASSEAHSVSILQAGDRKLNHVFYYENDSYKEEMMYFLFLL